jgi:type II secretory pathway predicted ATPase ExeA
MYFEYWQLQKPPFDNVPDPSMYAECHTSMENAIAETLFSIEEGNECLAVIIGDVGLGKTLSLRIIIDSLSPEKYQIALITNPSISFVQLLNEIIGQLTESPCNEKKKAGLLEIFNKLLFQAADAGKKIVLLIDEANAIIPSNLESLRLLTNMQDDRRNLFTMVLAGQIELARRLEDPKRANLFQRIGTYSRIEKIDSLYQLKTYVETRLRLAGASRPLFTEDTYSLFWKYSDQGVPRLINKIAKLCLKAGETHGLRQIDADVVYQVGRQFEKITVSPASRGKSKKRKEEPVFTETNEPPDDPKQKDAPNERKEIDGAAWREFKPAEVLTEPPLISRPQHPEGLEIETVANQNFSTEPAPVEVLKSTPKDAGEVPELLPKEGGFFDSLNSLALPFPQILEEEDFPPVGLEKIKETYYSESDQEMKVIPEEGPVGLNPEDLRSTEIPNEAYSQSPLPEAPESGPSAPGEISEEIQVGNFKILLNLPSQFVELALSSNREVRFEMAGQAAAQAMKKFSQLTSSPAADPVSIWSDLRSIIFKKLEPPESKMVA